MNEFERIDQLLATHRPEKADAIVLLAGDRFHRIEKAAELYEEGFAPRIVITSSADDWDYGSVPSSKLVPELLRAGVPESDILHEETAPHTREEADSTLRIAKEKGWKRLILVTTRYHSPRALLTWLKAIDDAGHPVELFVARVEGVPDFKQESEEELFAQETERIRAYQEKGDVASFAQGLSFFSR